MHYVLDTGFFILSRDYYPETFPSFWENLDKLVDLQKLSSVSEVEKELNNYGGKQQHLLQWIRKNKNIFTKPSIQEQQKVREIFSISNFKNLIKKKELPEGKAFADPFVIAEAMTIQEGIVVTRENPAGKDSKGNIQGSPKIPDVCKHFGIRCLNPQQFMEEQNWKF